MAKNKEFKVRFKNGERIYIMKVIEIFKNGDVKLIDGSIIEKDYIIEKIKI